jgi:hypothetical protein
LAGTVKFTGKAKSSYQLLVVLLTRAQFAVELRPPGKGLETVATFETIPYLETFVGEPGSKSLSIVLCPKTDVPIQTKKTLKGVKNFFIIIKIKVK